LNEIIFKALCACIGLAPSSEQALSMIRQAYTEPENTPQPGRTSDVIYWSLSPEEGSEDPASYNETDANSGSHKPAVHRFLAYRLLVVCYGPSCEAYARKIRAFLYIDGANLPRGILKKAGIYPVPDPPAPQLLYEPEGSLWRRRADLTISLRVKDNLIYSAGRGAITTAPAIVLHKTNP
jgi:hypothetical protein